MACCVQKKDNKIKSVISIVLIWLSLKTYATNKIHNRKYCVAINIVFDIRQLVIEDKIDTPLNAMLNGIVHW